MDSVDTPLEERGGIYIKRDDLYEAGGVRGGKVRTCFHLASRPGVTGLVTAGSRSSPQVNIVAHIAKHLGLPCRVHTPQGELSPEVLQARDMGAEVVQHRAGYNNVIIARARHDALLRGWTNIPFGMECDEAVRQTSGQVRSVAPLVQAGLVRRIVIPVGSGMSLCGVLEGCNDLRLREHGLSVLGVRVGADPTKRIGKYAPAGSVMVPWALADSGSDYHTPAPAEHVRRFPGVVLDPHYEAKCVPYLARGDLLWVVGVRRTAVD